MTVKGIDGKPLDKPSGFTISFKQLSPPELLRLEVVPHPNASQENAEAWREPPRHLRLIVPPAEGERLSFHDILALRSTLGLRPAPEFESWLERMEMLDPGGRMRPPLPQSPQAARLLSMAQDA